jgi:hypothetical protein
MPASLDAAALALLALAAFATAVLWAIAGRVSRRSTGRSSR